MDNKIKRITPETFKQILAKLYAVYSDDYAGDNNSRYEHIEVNGQLYKVGYVMGDTNKEPINVRIVRKSDS